MYLWSGARRHSREHARITATSRAIDCDMLLWFMQNAAKIGVVDTTSDSFSTIELTGISASSYRFSGAAAVGTKVYLAPNVSAALAPRVLVAVHVCTRTVAP